MKRRMSPNSLANLKPNKPGHNNGGGRPKGSQSISDSLRRLMDSEIKLKRNPITGVENDKMSVTDRIALAIAAKAMSGSEKAAEMIWERTEGKVIQPHQVNATGRLIIVRADQPLKPKPTEPK